MAALSDSALLTFAEYCEFVGEEATKISLTENRFNLFCNAASRRIEQFCDRGFRAVTDLVEVHSGDGEADLYVNNRPITATPTVRYWDGSQWVTTTGTFTYDSTTGRIRFTDGSVFGRGSDNWQITYSYGYAIAAIPYEIKAACAILIQRALKKADGKEGVSSETFAEQTVSFSLAKMPDDVAEMLQRHRRIIYG